MLESIEITLDRLKAKHYNLQQEYLRGNRDKKILDNIYALNYTINHYQSLVKGV